MKNSKAVVDDSRQLLSDLRALGLEAEKMIGDSTTEYTNGAFGRLREQFKTAQERFVDLYGTAREKTIAGARYTDETVRARPYESIAVGVGIGLLAGFLIGRSSKE